MEWERDRFTVGYLDRYREATQQVGIGVCLRGRPSTHPRARAADSSTSTEARRREFIGNFLREQIAFPTDQMPHPRLRVAEGSANGIRTAHYCRQFPEGRSGSRDQRRQKNHDSGMKP